MTTDTVVRPRLSILLHWLTVLLLSVAVPVILIRDDLEGKAIRLSLLNWHRTLGILLLVAVAFRFVAWLVFEIKNIRKNSINLLQIMAALAHLAIYGLLFIIPILGWMVSSARAC